MSAAGIVNTSFSSIFGQGFQKLDWILFLKKVYVPFSPFKTKHLNLQTKQKFEIPCRDERLILFQSQQFVHVGFIVMKLIL